MICLFDAKKGSTYHISKISPCKEKLRLMELGFVDCDVRVKAIGLKRGVFLVRLRDFEIIIKGSLAKNIMVQCLS